MPDASGFTEKYLERLRPPERQIQSDFMDMVRNAPQFTDNMLRLVAAAARCDQRRATTDDDDYSIIQEAAEWSGVDTESLTRAWKGKSWTLFNEARRVVGRRSATFWNVVTHNALPPHGRDNASKFHQRR